MQVRTAPQILDLSSFSRAGAMANGRPSLMAIANGSFGLCRFAPLVESLGWDQAAALDERLAERRCFVDGLSSGIDGPVSDLGIFGPIRDQPPIAARRAIVPEFLD